MDMIYKVRDFSKQIRFIRSKFVFQLIKHKGKLEYLKQLWRKEIQEMKFELMKDSKSKAGKERLKAFIVPDERLAFFLLRKYFERCKFKYVLAFL